MVTSLNSDKIKRVVDEVTKNGLEFPRAVFAIQLVELGLKTTDEWIEYAKKVVLDPKNYVGRTLILLRAKKEMLQSPAILVARGRGGNLPESYLQPHIENKNCKYEKLSLLEGKAILIKLDMQGSLLEALPISKKIIEIKPGEVHTVIFDSPLVVLYEVKKVIPGLDKIFIPNSVPEGDPRVPQLLEEWHHFADLNHLPSL